MRIQVMLLGFVALVVASLGYAAEPRITHFSLTPGEDSRMYFTYHLTDPEDEFLDALRDAVRGHSQVLVTHRVTISPLGGLWGKRVSVETHYAVAYDVLRELFDVGGTATVRNLSTHDEGAVSDLLLGVTDLPLIETHQLYRGQQYKISVRVTIEAAQRSRWTRWLPLKWFGKEEVYAEAYYTAH